MLVLLSDGEDHGGGLEQEIARLRDDGVVVHAFGVGTPERLAGADPGDRRPLVQAARATAAW